MKMIQCGGGTAEIKFYLYPIPFLLYFSKSILDCGGNRGIVYSLHITPFVAVGFVWPEFWFKESIEPDK